MTFTAVPYALQNGSHSADLFRQAAASLVPPGGGIITTGDLAVTQTGTPSMNVSIGVGRCWIPGTNVGNVTGGNFSSQAMYYGQNASAYTASVATADSLNPRIDVVYASVQDSQYAGTTNAGVLAVVSGVPTSGATYPANAPTIPANSVALAWITVPANAPSIVNANITSLSGFGIGLNGVISTIWTNSSNAVTTAGGGPGTLTLDSANSQNPSSITSPGAGQIQVARGGVYAITWHASSLASTSGYMSVKNQAGTGTYALINYPAAGEQTVSIPNLYLAAGAVITFVMGPSANVTIGSTIRVSKIG